MEKIDDVNYLIQVYKCLEMHGYQQDNIIKCNYLLFLSHVYALLNWDDIDGDKNYELRKLDFRAYPSGPVLNSVLQLQLIDDIDKIFEETECDSINSYIELIVDVFGNMSMDALSEFVVKRNICWGSARDREYEKIDKNCILECFDYFDFAYYFKINKG